MEAEYNIKAGSGLSNNKTNFPGEKFAHMESIGRPTRISSSAVRVSTMVPADGWKGVLRSARIKAKNIGAGGRVLNETATREGRARRKKE